MYVRAVSSVIDVQEFKPEELTLGKIGLEVWDRVIAMNAEDLPRLKSKLGEWGPPAQNEVILRQNDQLKVTCITSPYK